jgi:hypothetical protein
MKRTEIADTQHIELTQVSTKTMLTDFLLHIYGKLRNL